MAHVPYVQDDGADDVSRPIFESMSQKLGMIPNIFRAMANSPELFKGFMELNGALKTTALDPKLRELAYLATSEVNRCEY